jgi:predicted Fe-Mo cluster-binding NifX family protein
VQLYFTFSTAICNIEVWFQYSHAGLYVAFSTASHACFAIIIRLARVLIFLSVMEVAITCWHGRVSPVLDVASTVLLVTLEGDRETMRQEVSIEGTGAMHRTQHILRLGVNTVICGAVSRPLELALGAVGVEVIAHVCGKTDDVLKAFIEERLDDEEYLMPGCCRLRRRRCGGESQGGGCLGRHEEGGALDD